MLNGMVERQMRKAIKLTADFGLPAGWMQNSLTFVSQKSSYMFRILY